MTALTQYAKLETVGLWRPDPEAQRREVVVCFGDATLILRDMAGRPLAHWSMAAIRRANPGQMPAVFAPGDGDSETLEIEDDLMVSSIEKVRKSIARRRPREGRVRGAGISVVLGVALVAGALWLPGALRERTLEAVPETKRAEIGATILGHLQRLTGNACRNPRSVQALGRLTTRALGRDYPGQVVVVPDVVQGTLMLPGQIIVMNRSVVEDYEDPAVAAGYMIAAVAERGEVDPLDSLLRETGLRATVHLLTTGDFPSDALRRYAEVIAARAPTALAPDALIGKFAEAQISTRPYAYAVDITGETTLPLIEADPVNPADAPQILTDGDWVALQGICGN